jgi:hypothetical protein
MVSLFNSKARKAEKYANAQYEALRATREASVKGLYDYYKGIQAWANITEGDITDRKVMACFKKLAAGYDSSTEKMLWKEISSVWVSGAGTMDNAQKEVFTLRTDSITRDTAREDINLLGREMLAAHVMAHAPYRGDVGGAEHYMHFVDKVVSGSHGSGNYRGNDPGWFLVHKVLQESWLRQMNIEMAPGGFDELVRIHRVPAVAPKVEPEAKPAAAAPEMVTPPIATEKPVAEAGPSGAAAELPTLRQEEPVPETRRPTPPPPPPISAFVEEELLRRGGGNGAPEPKKDEKSLLQQQLDDWIRKKLTVGETGELDRDRFEVFDTFEDALVKEKQVVNGSDVRRNGYSMLILSETEKAANGAGLGKDYYEQSVYAIRLEHEDRAGSMEIYLAAALLSAKSVMPESAFAEYMNHVGLRAEALRKGYEVLFDLGGKIYVLRAPAEQSILRKAA